MDISRLTPQGRSRWAAFASAVVTIPLCVVVLLPLSRRLYPPPDHRSSLQIADSKSPGAAVVAAVATADPLPNSSRPGAILSTDYPTLSSPNGAFILTLRPSGDLALTCAAGWGKHPLWWTSTGDGVLSQATHSVSILAAADGGSLLVVEEQLDGKWRTVWHSDLEPACEQRSLGMSTHIDEEFPRGRLQISNSGRLSIAGVCDLYIPLNERDTTRSLAVVVAGLYRTNDVACDTHMRSIVSNHSSFARVDVFTYMVYEETDITQHGRTPGSIEAAVRECYGASLKAIQVVNVVDVEEEYPGGELAMLQPCGRKLRRLNNQLKTLDDARKMWWAWAVQNGFTHDTVLRLRPDTNFYSDVEAPFWSLEDLGANTLVLPHADPAGGHYYYCARMSGRVGVGPTDQIAYGSPAAMQHWLSMYRDFAQMVDLASNPDRAAWRDFSGCEDLPSGPAPGDCPRPAPCSIECLVAWYLEANGVEFSVEWGWDQGLLRG